MHHVGKLEKLLGACLRALKPGGTLYLDELIGPSRSEWSDDAIADARRAFDAVPREARTCEVLPYPIQIDDPSEALRSGEILEQLAIGFETIAFQGYGGNVLAVLYPAVRWRDVDPSLIHELIEADRRVAWARGPYHAVIVAKPKRGVSRSCAKVRYFLEPKWRRVRLEVLRRLGKSARF
jgi:SAM-dependent methyltransferase